MFNNVKYEKIINNNIYVFTSDILLYYSSMDNCYMFDTNETILNTFEEGMLPFNSNIKNEIELNLMLSKVNNITKNLIYLECIDINENNKSNLIIDNPVVLNISNNIDKIIIKNINNIPIFIGLKNDKYVKIVSHHRDPVMNIYYDIYYIIGLEINLSQMYILDNVSKDDKILKINMRDMFKYRISLKESYDNNLFNILYENNNIYLVYSSTDLINKQLIKLELNINLNHNRELTSDNFNMIKTFELMVFKSDNMLLTSILPYIKTFPLLLNMLDKNIIIWNDLNYIIKYFLNNKDCPHLKLINILKNGIITTKKQSTNLINKELRVFKLNDTELILFDIILDPIIIFLNSWKKLFDNIIDLEHFINNLNLCLISLRKMRFEFILLNELVDKTILINILTIYIDAFSDYYNTCKTIIEIIINLLKQETLNDQIIQLIIFFKSFASFGKLNIKVFNALHSLIKYLHSNIPIEFNLEKISINHFILVFDSGLTNRNIKILSIDINQISDAVTITRDVNVLPAKFNIIVINKLEEQLNFTFDIKLYSDNIEYNKKFYFS